MQTHGLDLQSPVSIAIGLLGAWKVYEDVRSRSGGLYNSQRHLLSCFPSSKIVPGNL